MWHNGAGIISAAPRCKFNPHLAPWVKGSSITTAVTQARPVGQLCSRPQELPLVQGGQKGGGGQISVVFLPKMHTPSNYEEV